MNTVTSTNGTGKPVRVVTGQYIAKAHRTYPAWSRAEDAARWLRGEIQIKPTAKLAAETFNVPVPLVAKAREHLARLEEWRERSKHRNGNGTGTAAPDDATIKRLVAGFLAKMTTPEPMQAAE